MILTLGRVGIEHDQPLAHWASIFILDVEKGDGAPLLGVANSFGRRTSRLLSFAENWHHHRHVAKCFSPLIDRTGPIA
uniref:Uncharacterized protein n=1 Tax=Magnetospirillum gryphiswaldense TaxID=55518 RepID=Q3BKG6_9PROT|nr:hypothetical protein mgI409 [Magnetospirillum gryphiswaldense MSR-1]CAM77965.1 hypothetical protein MGR_4033 [Magnetospirillum gryphiswaldense MSR-1]